MKKADFEAVFEKKQNYFIDGWKEFLRFQSISTNPAYDQNCIECANWLAAELKRIGLNSSLLETPGKPVVFAEYKGKAGAPVVSYYGHYDVQPVDPLELWSSKPFDPLLKDGRLYARGAQDNKGQSWYFIKAVEELIQAGQLNCSLKLFIEGEEESSSKGINESLVSWRERLRSDLLMVCDTGSIKAGLPAITMGLRGIIFLTAKLSGPRCDLHSGIHGGVIRNPATEMARLVTSLHNPDGSIAVKGFYDKVASIDAEDLKLANAIPLEIKFYEQMVGVEAVGGEKKFSPIERRGFRPTVEVNGIHSGYDGPGSKTIIPAVATAKITSRLVANQDPKECLELLIAHLKQHSPNGLRLEISEQGVGGPAVLVSSKAKYVGKAAKVLEQLSNMGVCYIWEGASIPVVASLVKESGAEPILVGFGLEEDNIHAPNESFSLEQFKQGFLYVSMFLSSL